MVKKLKIIKCIFILFCVFSVVKSYQVEYIDEDIYDLKNACINCDNHNIFSSLLVKRDFGTKRNKGVVARIKEENKKKRMGKLIKNLNKIVK